VRRLGLHHHVTVLGHGSGYQSGSEAEELFDHAVAGEFQPASSTFTSKNKGMDLTIEGVDSPCLAAHTQTGMR
jgi:hypothetical protein